MALFLCLLIALKYRLESAYVRLTLVYTLELLQSPYKRFKKVLQALKKP